MSSSLTPPFIGDPIAWRRHKLESLRGKTCFGGLDVGVVDDFTCNALYFPKQKNMAKDVLLLWAWVPQNVDHHQALKERFGYDDWVRGGFLKLTSGCRTDYA